jgi:hypothetical protein
VLAPVKRKGCVFASGKSSYFLFLFLFRTFAVLCCLCVAIVKRKGCVVASGKSASNARVKIRSKANAQVTLRIMTFVLK